MNHVAVGPDSRVYLVDGSGFIFRAFHALPPLTRKRDGLPVGAVSGFCNMLFKLLQDSRGPEAPTHLAVVFDSSRVSFRTALYPAYKAQRPEPPEELKPQFPLIRDATRAFNVAAIELEGFEADDIIATYARQAAELGAQVTIISSDKDLMQLINDRVRLWDAVKNKAIGPAEVQEKFGVPPDRVVDVQALAGDSVDNVPGAPGIGIKTAAQLITEYGDLETLLARAHEIKQPKRREVLTTMADQVRLSRQLVTLDAFAPVPVALADLGVRAIDPQQLIAFLKAMEFRGLVARVATQFKMESDVIAADDLSAAATPVSEQAAVTAMAEAPATEAPAFANYTVIRDADTLAEWVRAATAQGYVAVDTETTSLNEMQAELVGISLALAPGRACYVPIGHSMGTADLFGGVQLAPGQISRDLALKLLAPLLADPAVLKIGQNLKYDLKVLARYGLEVTPIDDTMLMSYALESGLTSHGMDALSQRHLDHTPVPIKELIGSGKGAISFDRVEIEKAAHYAAEDADVTWRLWTKLKPALVRAGLTTVYETLERPLVPVLAAMERAGVLVDRAKLAALSAGFAQSMLRLEAEAHRLAGEPFNLGSPKQLGEILFERMALPGGEKTKTGAWATGADVLETLAAAGHELPAVLLDWRGVAKLKSTYTDALPEHIDPHTGRVHTSFSMAATSTGRLASTDPNLQNIPIRTEEGRRIREAFIAPKGKLLLSLDYSQIELRILAHIARIDPLIEAFHQGIDIHAMTAAQVFGVPIEGMDPMIRRKAKAINFGVIYGISAFGLSNQLRIPREEAKSFIDAYFARFPGIRAYMDRTVASARERGYVETLFGRRIHTPEINTKGPMRGFQERAAINAPIQGTAADIIRRAMIRIPPLLAARRLPATMLLQVHDELIFEVEASAADEAMAAIKQVMEAAAAPLLQLAVPLVVDGGKGESWAAAH